MITSTCTLLYSGGDARPFLPAPLSGLNMSLVPLRGGHRISVQRLDQWGNSHHGSVPWPLPNVCPRLNPDGDGSSPSLGLIVVGWYCVASGSRTISGRPHARRITGVGDGSFPSLGLIGVWVVLHRGAELS